MDKLTKSAYFILFRIGQWTEMLTKRFMQVVVRLHKVITIIDSNHTTMKV